MTDPAAPVVPPPPAAPPTAPPAEPGKGPQVISVLPDDWKAMHERLAKFEQREAERQREIDTQQKAALEAQAAKDGTQKQFQEYQSAQELRFNEMKGKFDVQEREILTEKLNGVIAEALGGIKLVPAPGVDPSVIYGQVKRLLMDEIEATKDATGRPTVRDKKTFRPALEYLKERLASPEYAIYLAPTTKGGSGTGPAAQNRPPGTPAPEAGSLENIVNEWKTRQNQFQSFGLRPTGK
jgi:hypothetical protein